MARALALLILASSVAAGAAVPAQTTGGCTIHNLMPEFWQFWDSTSQLDAKRRSQQMEQRFIGRHAHVYRPEVLSTGDDSATVDSMAAEFVRIIGPQVPRMRTLSSQLESGLPGYLERFHRAFPDFHCSFPIYILPSLGAFDGATRDVDGTSAFMIGVDVVAEVYGEGDLGSFFTHELFHQYHYRTNPPPSGLVGSLWEEGLATYVSHALNPRISESVVLGRPADLAHRARPRLPQIATELLRNFNSDSQEEYATFFLGNKNHAGIPPRSGYYVGYLIAGDLGKRYSLEQLAQLKGQELRAQIRRELERLRQQ